MGKKIKTTMVDLGGKKLIEFHTSMLNKHGELKGRNKKETKIIKETCMHHKVGKKGKLKSRVEVTNGIGHCTMCGEDFRAVPYTKEERNEICGNIKELANHTKYLAAAVGANEDVQRVLAETCISIDNLKHINKKYTKIVEKQEKLKSKNKKNKESSTLGNWRIRH